MVVGGVAWRWVAPRVETPSVAVLPFSTIGGGDQYFADGITENSFCDPLSAVLTDGGDRARTRLRLVRAPLLLAPAR